MLLRGTRLHARAAALGLVSSDQLHIDLHERVGSGIPHVVESPTFSFDEWLQMHTLAQGINQAYAGRSRPKRSTDGFA